MSRLLIVLVLMTSTNLFAKEAAVFCPLYHYQSVKKTVESSGSHDKFKHCAVSCLLALKCSAVDVLEIGIIKELADMVGPGNAEMADLQADYDGVALVVKKKAQTVNTCLSACHKLYPADYCQ